MSQVHADVVMAETPSSRTRSRRLVTIVAVALGSLGLVAGAVALGDSTGVWRTDGLVHVEVRNLDVIYQSERIDQARLQVLNDQGLALFTATDVDSAAELNATRAFDSQTELDAYCNEYTSWLTAKRDGDSVQPWATVAPQSWSAPDD